MAVLTEMPSQAFISGFKGTVDYYAWKGVPVARKWPRSPGKRRAPAVEAQWSSFTYASQEWALLAPSVQAAYNEMARSSGLSGRDLQERAYLSGLYHYELG